MCGIFGIVSNSIVRDLDNSLELLKRRGPDFVGKINAEFSNGSVSRHFALGQTRLSIIDLNDRANQPFFYNNYILVFNGEIFNYVELKKELLKKDYVFTTESDTEVILVAYQEWGYDCFSKFNGFWSLCILNSKNGEVILSRDRFGIKPLYYYCDLEKFIFSSEIKPIAQYLGNGLEFDHGPLIDHFISENLEHTEKTIYKNIYSLTPNSYALVLNNKIIWKKPIFGYPTGEFISDEKKALEEFEFLFEQSVRLRVRSDVPVALTLSGGIDSTAIALALKNCRIEDYKSFSVEFPNKKYDEKKIVEQTASHLDIDINFYNFEEQNSIDDILDFALCQELGFTSFSQFMNYSILGKVSKEGFKVFLTGQGGDEVFMGYPRHMVAFLNDSNSKTDFTRRFIKVMQNSGLSYQDAVGQYIYFKNFLNLRVNKNLRKYNFFTNSRDFDRRKLQKVDVDLKSLQISEIFEGQLSRLLRLDDRSSGCHGLEGRPVFLDNDLVNFALRLSPDLLIRNGWSKYLVRKYLSKHGLDFVAWNKRKIGFQAPEEYFTKLVWNKIGDSFKIDDFTNRIDSTNTRYIIYELTKLQMFKSHYPSYF